MFFNRAGHTIGTYEYDQKSPHGKKIPPGEYLKAIFNKREVQKEQWHE